MTYSDNVKERIAKKIKKLFRIYLMKYYNKTAFLLDLLDIKAFKGGHR